MKFVIFILIITNILTLLKILYLESEAAKLKAGVSIYKLALEIEQQINNKSNN